MRTTVHAIVILMAFMSGCFLNGFFRLGQRECWSSIAAVEDVDLSEVEIARWNAELDNRVGPNSGIKCVVVPTGARRYDLHYFNILGTRSVPAKTINICTEVSHEYLLDLASSRTRR
jgi:hypothetical protein